MNNNLKFRAFDLKSKEMIDTIDFIEVDSEGKLFRDDKILMQFTGLKDILDKEIYEGDIVECDYGFGKVIFNAGCFMVEWLSDTDVYMEFVFSRKGMYNRTNGERFKIIGNIFQNPELLYE